MNKKVTRELIDKQLGVKGFSSNSANVQRLSDPAQDTPMLITLDQLRSYELNPRKTRNPKYDEIKESILARGLDDPPQITRRPGEDHYIIRSGGNTRLEILNELWRETKDDKYYKINCLFKPWKSETDALAGHLAENDVRGRISFIDKAEGVAKMKKLHEANLGESLSLRKLSAKLKEDGYPVSIGLLSSMLECVNCIQPALPNTLLQGLGRPQVARLIQLKNNLTKVWNKNDETGSEFLEFWIMVLSAHDLGVENFNYDVIQDEMLGQMSAMLGKSYNTLELDLAVSEDRPVNKNPLSEEQLAAIANSPPEPVQTDNQPVEQLDQSAEETAATEATEAVAETTSMTMDQKVSDQKSVSFVDSNITSDLENLRHNIKRLVKDDAPLKSLPDTELAKFIRTVRLAQKAVEMVLKDAQVIDIDVQQNADQG